MRMLGLQGMWALAEKRNANCLLIIMIGYGDFCCTNTIPLNVLLKKMTPARGPQTKLKGNHDRQAIGSWARYLGFGTQAAADDEQS